MEAQFSELSLEDCLERLASKSVGRVAYTERAMPAVLPVNYGLDGHRIMFRTRANSRLAHQMDNTVVAFEVDEVDEQLRSGWSVLVTGVARLVREPSETLRLDHAWPLPWAGGDRRQIVVITPAHITGRRVGASLAS
jgi:nitroimidazol reductase NimA-like FMN-containing flavoprotein (pyridoxamine 5'-phosphate oxidase superfamily)